MIDIFLEENLVLDADLITEEVLDVDFPEGYTLDVVLFDVTDEAFVDLETDLPHTEIELEIGTVLCDGGGYPEYQGPYEATPKVTDQIFNTDHTSMLEDFKVNKITYLRNINESGGYTVTIGDI